MGSIIVSKSCLEFVKYWFRFLMFLGMEALLGNFKSEKMPTVPREIHLFAIVVFLLFAALMALFGSSWSVVGGLGSQKFVKK